MGIRTEVADRWVRAYVDGVVVVDSRRPVLFWEDDLPVPHYAFPLDDVRPDMLQPTTSDAPDTPFFGPTSAVAQMFDVVLGARRVPRAAWLLEDPALEGHVVLTWEPGVLDRWTEEDQEVVGHPKDPYKRVDALPSSRHVRVEVEGRVLAESDAPVLLFETGLPVRYYLPEADVRLDLLEPERHDTICPYKGTADRYWGLPDLPHVAWGYTDPDPAVGAIAGRVAFYNEAVDLIVDGEPAGRPDSPFSAGRP